MATNLSAGPVNVTTFTHLGGVPPASSGGGGGGGGGAPSSPASATLASPGTGGPAGDKDKTKPADALPAFPTLPDLKELEKLLRDMIKEMEKQQRENSSSATTLSATATYALPDSAYTNHSAGFYVITRATEDTDLDGMPDWWEAQYDLNLLANDAQTDSDGDGVPNLAEYAYGTNPRDPNSRPIVQVTFTSPVNTNTWLPVVQITGSVNLNVRSLFYGVTNAAGIRTDIEGFVTRRTVVPGPGFTNSPPGYTNAFQCFDVALTNGVNAVGLRFTDHYGLTFGASVSFAVDVNASPAAPVATVSWPAHGAQLATDTFTLRGRLDNPTANVVARLIIEGKEQEIGGLVERDGTFWLEDLPTATGSPLTLVFTDAGGKATTNTLNLSRSPVSFTLQDPSGPSLWDSTVHLGGTVSEPNYSVWVNGIRATTDGNGNWFAENVPVNAGGVASFALRAVPNSDNGGAGTGAQAMAGKGGLGGLYHSPTGNPGSAAAVDATFDFDKPPRIVVSSHTMRSQDDNPTYETGHTNLTTLDWSRSGAGNSGSATGFWLKQQPGYQEPALHDRQTVYPWPGTNGVETGVYAWSLGLENHVPYTNAVGEPFIPWETGSVYQRTVDRSHSYRGETLLELQTGGRGLAHSASLFEFAGAAVGYNAEGGSAQLAPETLAVMDLALDTNGLAYRENLPANSTFAISFAAGNAAAQMPPTSQPSTGARIAYSISNGDIQLRLTEAPYYQRPAASGTGGSVRTNAPPLYLGYGKFVLPYDLGFRGRLDGLQHMITGAEPLVIQYQYHSGLTPGKYDFKWDGTVPRKTIGGVAVNQRMNTRQFINPQVTSLRAQVDAWIGGSRTNYATLKQPAPNIKVVGKAVVARSGAGSAGHLSLLASHLQTMGYTVEADNALELNSLTNRAALGLIWYSITHGQSAGGDFQGIEVERPLLGSGKLVTPTNLPSGLNYLLVFLNGCFAMQNDGGSNQAQAFANKFGAQCYVGWSGAVDPAIATDYAKRFFEHLATGKSVAQAISAVNGTVITLANGTTKTIGELDASNDVNVFPKVLVKNNISALGNTAMIIDLRN